MAKIGGVAVATVTPFRDSGEIDYVYIEKHLELLQREGAHGIVPVGTNGEFPSLTLEEKKRVIDAAGASRGELFMMVGAGSCSLPEVVELLEFAQDAGADAALVVPPFYYRDASVAGIIEFYRAVLESTGLPVFLYNIPMYSGIAITDEIIGALAGNRNFAGIKDTGGDPARTAALIARYPGLKIWGGSDSLMEEAVGAGAAGVISGVANIYPGLVREMWEARSDQAALGQAAARVRAVRGAIKEIPWVAATKYGLKLRGLPVTRVRPPQVELTGEQKEAFRKALAAAGVLD